VAPWLAWLRAGVFDRYGAVCKLHGKRSPHMAGGDAWRDELLQALLGSTAQTAGIVAQFQAQPRLGLLGPAAGYLPVAQANGWAKNRLRVQRLARQLHAPLVGTEPRFFAGTMFWFRASALAPLRHSTLQLDDFPLEMGQTEGTVAHALERLVPSIVQAAGHLVLAWPQPLPPSPDPCT
jgi:rhamnosyltransferase